jgi:hypothetical protein
MPAAETSSRPSSAVKTDVPARLDRLPWSRFHLLIVVGLGVTWILDGLEVTIVGALGPALQSPQTLHLSSENLGAVASFYVIGAVSGALISGWSRRNTAAASTSSSTAVFGWALPLVLR